MAQRDLLAGSKGSLNYASDGEAAQVVGSVEVGDNRLERGLGIASRWWDGFDDGVENRTEVGVGIRNADACGRPTHAGDGGHDRKLDVVVAGIEVEEQLVHLVDHLGGAGIAPVHLVHHHDGGQVACQRLGEHVAGLWHWSFGRIDQQDDPVDERQGALDLTTEVGVTGGVDQVDPNPFPLDRGRLRQDRDPSLSLLVVGVHHSVHKFLVVGEHPRGAQHGIDQRGLAMVDMRDKRDVAKGGRGHGDLDGTDE